jgi:hypothetical protein
MTADGTAYMPIFSETVWCNMPDAVLLMRKAMRPDTPACYLSLRNSWCGTEVSIDELKPEEESDDADEL